MRRLIHLVTAAAAAATAVVSVLVPSGAGARPAEADAAARAAAAAGPVESFYAESNWGDLFGATAGRPNPHQGLDIQVPRNSRTPVPALRGGPVVLTGTSDCLGNYVVIEAGPGDYDGYSHIYAPIGRGTQVASGQNVGYTAANGDTVAHGTCWGGSHLHLTNSSTADGFGNGNVRDPAPVVRAVLRGGTGNPALHVFEAASNNGWRSQGVGADGVGIRAESVAAITVGDVKYVYTVNGGYVYEAASNNGWRNQSTGIAGASVAALAVNGVKHVYTVSGGYVHEAASNNGWRSLSTGVPASSVAATAVGDVKYLYTVNQGYVYEAASNNAWRSQPMGVAASSVAAITVGGVKLVYTVNGGYVYEAASDNGWRSLSTGVPASSVTATAVGDVKYLYARS
ncbi:MAG: M23 family metallopeptidase [Dermatophilaceae bacterium]